MGKKVWDNPAMFAGWVYFWFSAAIVLLEFAPPASARQLLVDVPLCLDYISQSNDISDTFLEDFEFLNLIQLLDTDCPQNEYSSATLTQTIRDKFLELACPCLASLDDPDCCTSPEDQKFDLQIALQDPMLVCLAASSLVGELQCSEAEATNPPTVSPSALPTKEPTNPPTVSPSTRPTEKPTNPPTVSPSAWPTVNPANPPTVSPSAPPTKPPTNPPTVSPSARPTDKPTDAETTNPPTASPSASPTEKPTDAETTNPRTESRSPSASPPTAKPTKAPSVEQVFTLYPTLNLESYVVPTALPVTPQPSSSPSTREPSRAPAKNPTDLVFTAFPTLNVEQTTPSPTRKPTVSTTNPPTLSPMEGPAFSTRVPVETIATAFPSLRVEAGSTAPTFVADEIPPPSPVAPSVPSPTPPIDEGNCERALKEADANNNGRVTIDEYLVFTQIFANCRGITSLNTAQRAAFFGASLARSSIDISALYEPLSDETVGARAFITYFVCAPNALTHPDEEDCVNPPTDEPTDSPVTPAPVTPPTPVNPPVAPAAPVNPPVTPAPITPVAPANPPANAAPVTPTPVNPPVNAAPANQAPPPTLDPTVATAPVIPPEPTAPQPSPAGEIFTAFPALDIRDPDEPQTAPQPSPADEIFTAFPDLNIRGPDDPDAEFAACTDNMLAANVAGDRPQLDRSEYLRFIVLQSGCDLITSLSAIQAETFNTLACLCTEIEGTVPNCCSQQNARVSIDGAALPPEDRTAAQEADLRVVCSATANAIPDVCAAPPASPVPTFPPAAAPLPPLATKSPSSPPQDAPINPPRDAPTQTPNLTPTRTTTAAPQPDGPVLVETPQTGVPSNTLTGEPVAQAGTTGAPVAISTANPASAEMGTTDAPVQVPGQAPTVNPPSTDAVTLPPTKLPTTLGQVQRDPTESPVVPPTYSLPTSCTNALLASDRDVDGFLNEAEFLLFVQERSQCALTTQLSADQKELFTELVFGGCLVSFSEDLVDCFYPPKLFIQAAALDAGSRTALQTNFLAEVCLKTDRFIPDVCVAPPTMTPLEADYFEDCTAQLVVADGDEDELIDQDEYLAFLQSYGQCPFLTSLDIGHYATFLTLASFCSQVPGNPFDCALPGNAKLNISGSALPDVDRTAEQTTSLLQICITADGLTRRECVEPPTPASSQADCSAALVSSDQDLDGHLDMEEYLSFVRQEYDECAQIQSLSLTQRFVWNLLSCSCLLQPGASIDCCYPDVAKIDIDGAGLSVSDRSFEQSGFLSTVCKASNATMGIGCRTFPPTFAPSLMSSETFAPSWAPTHGIRVSQSQSRHVQTMFAMVTVLIGASITASFCWG